ncbi:MAG: 16S rRNA (uracil(1498)-N(3))-methyltransferase [Alteromonadaceae bacterium]|nr:16S rRNA (uracil(1498)-N(3))-methyltransferase [Alteromonadaceae bacterium]
MRIPRLFVDQTLAVDEEIPLSKELSNYVVNVLRLKDASPVVLFNGDGNEYSAELEILSKRSVNVRVDSKLGISCESPLPIHLGQGISKGDRMDMVIQKSVELGVTEISPIITERCNVKLDDERWQKKQQHWQKIAISACEQCGRNVVPTIHAPITLAQWLSQSTNQLRLTLNPTAEKRLARLDVPKEGIRVLIGPEGGLSDQEIFQAAETGFNDVSLGPRILRTETAALAVISILQANYGDL